MDAASRWHVRALLEVALRLRRLLRRRQRARARGRWRSFSRSHAERTREALERGRALPPWPDRILDGVVGRVAPRQGERPPDRRAWRGPGRERGREPERRPDRPQDRFPDRPQDRFPDRPPDRFPDRPHDRFPDRPHDRFPDRPHDRFPDRPHDRFPDRPHDRFPDRPPDRASAPSDRARPRAARWRERFETELRQIAAAEDHGPPPTVVESPAVPNVGTRGAVVAVNPDWMEQVSDGLCDDDETCRRDLVRGIAAHEWSHVVDARSPARGRTRHQRELDADRHAGRVLERSGASVGPLLALLQAGPSEASATHPGRDERVSAVLAGHRERSAGGCECERCRVCDDGHDGSDVLIQQTPPARPRWRP